VISGAIIYPDRNGLWRARVEATVRGEARSAVTPTPARIREQIYPQIESLLAQWERGTRQVAAVETPAKKATPGEHDHRALECGQCADTTLHRRPYKSRAPWSCTVCEGESA
jgi:hypothetical protein